MNLKVLKSDLFWPLVILSFVGMTLLVGTVFTLVRQFDVAARDREQVVVENGVIGRMDEVARKVVTETTWDDAVRNLDNRFDSAWARENIGQFLAQSDGFDESFVLDGRDLPVFAYEGASEVPVAAFARFEPQVLSIVRSVRAAEARHGPPSRKPRDSVLPPPIQASVFAMVDGRPHILTATLVQPDFGEALPSGPRAPVVVAGMEMDAAFLEAFARRYMLDDLRLRPAGAAHDRELARAVLRGERGQAVAVLSWTPQNPGRTLLRNLVAPILLVVAALGVAALVLYRRSRRMAQGLIASEARASHLAYHDALTGLPNRVLFFDRLTHALDQLRRDGPAIAIHALDLDRFKDVNDTFGHLVGDELIQEAARRMSALCRSSDTFARLSGDEFAIVQSGATAASAAALAARLIEAMNQPFDLAAGRVFVGCSIGVAMIADGALDPPEALRQADLALYRAKGLGGVQYCFFELEMDAAIKMRRALEGDLREALAAGALEMAYQPQVDRKGAMTGVEALVRWNHPTRGMVSPAFFVPIAEECGLIVELGLFTLRRAFEDSRRWPDLKTAINISANQIRMKDFVSSVEALVAELEVDPRRFELEITEGLLLGDDPATHDTLKRLRQLGFSLALDDFGTGYSSLSYLQRFPVTKIKIDRSFIANLGVDAESDAVVGAIVKLARALNLAVIAEGVETSEQRERLAAAGCGEVQGFLYSRPVTPDEIIRLQKGRRLMVQPG